MTPLLLAQLHNRSLIEVKGPDAVSFLQGLVTTDVETLAANEMAAGALLSPQGKIMFDFLVGKDDERLFLESRQEIADDLSKKLSLYKLRSKVEIILHNQSIVDIFLGDLSNKLENYHNKLIFNDKRFVDTIAIYRKIYLNKEFQPTDITNKKWHEMRIDNGIAESGTDFTLGEVFPHDINLDQIGGVSFKKGCYIGQEVVSRMHHRGTARRRILLGEANTLLPPAGSLIEAMGKVIGSLGSSVGHRGLALVRLDRAKAAMNMGRPITAAGIELTLTIPPSVQFTWPEGA